MPPTPLPALPSLVDDGVLAPAPRGVTENALVPPSDVGVENSTCSFASRCAESNSSSASFSCSKLCFTSAMVAWTLASMWSALSLRELAGMTLTESSAS